MNETAPILAQMVDRLFADHVDMTLLASANEGHWAQELWTLVEQQGLPWSLVPEEQGGMGASFHDAFVIVRATGRHRAPVPLPETMAAGWLLAMAGLKLPVGPLTIAGTQSGDSCQLDRSGADWRLSGSIHRVPWGRVANSVVLTLRHDGKTLIVQAARNGAIIERAANLAGEFRDTLTFRNHPVEVAPWNHAFTDDPVAVVGAMMRGGQMAGALADVLARSVVYVGERQQFGRLIGKQQAVQQNLAILAEEVAATEAAAEAAFLAFDRGDPEFLVAVAKVRAGIAVSQAIGIAHQVHGAIGFAREHPLHASTLRLMSWRNEFGGDRRWAVALGQRVLAAGADGFWPHITAG
ncbi:MAG: acyl-CoA dehydrogenase family protein [Methylocella sp.]